MSLRHLLPEMRWMPLWIAPLMLLFFQQAAHADVWGYVDDKGLAHFAAERVDARYELFFKADGSFDTSQDLRGPIDTPRPVALPAAPAKLIAFFEVSTNFKAVKHLMREASAAQNIDFELLQALIATESGFDAAAVSPKGAIGLMQVIPATAQRYGVAADKSMTAEKKLVDPRTNIRAGTRYLRDLLNLFGGRLELALAAYNAGEGSVQRAGNRIPNYPETQNYVKTVMQIYTLLKQPELSAERRPISRVRVELPSPRNNMPLPVGTAALGLPEFKIERD